MPPVEVLNDKGARRRLRFVRNTSYEGADYGPGYANDTADVDSHWAPIFIANGRAVEVAGGAPIEAAQIREPEAEHRDPAVKKN